MQPLPDMNQLLKLASSPAGQKLLALRQKESTVDFKKVAQSGSAGIFEGAIQQMSDFLASKEVQQLLKQLENPHE